MSAEATAPDARLAFIFPDAEPTPPPLVPTPPPGPRDPGPMITAGHRLHGSLPININSELRITSQRGLGADRPARICVRRWFRKDGVWWTDRTEPGDTITAKHARAFLAAVQAAVAALEGDERQRTDERGEP